MVGGLCPCVNVRYKTLLVTFASQIRLQIIILLVYILYSESLALENFLRRYFQGS